MIIFMNTVGITLSAQSGYTKAYVIFRQQLKVYNIIANVLIICKYSTANKF